MLTVGESRQGRSRSPGARDRERSHSRDTRVLSPPKKEHKRSVRITIDESSESEETHHRVREKKSSKKYDHDDQEDRRRGHKKSAKTDEDSDSEENDPIRRRAAPPPTRTPAKKFYSSDSDGDQRSMKENKHSRRGRESGSESGRHPGRSKRSSRKYESESTSSEEDPRYQPSHGPARNTYREEERNRERHSGFYQLRPPQTPYSHGGQDQYSQFPPSKYHETRHESSIDPRTQHGPPGTAQPTHTDRPDSHRVHPTGGADFPRYAQLERYQYAQPDPRLVYKPQMNEDQYARSDPRMRYRPRPEDHPQHSQTYHEPGEVQYVDVTTQDMHKTEFRQHIQSFDRKGQPDHTEVEAEAVKKDKKGKEHGSPSSESVSLRLSHLAVGGTLGAGARAVARHGSQDGGRPPASPLLEAYKGTYQSISPMPSPIMHANGKPDADLSDLDLSDPEPDHKSKPKVEAKADVQIIEREPHRRESSTVVTSPGTARKHVAFYDPENDAKKIAAALQGTHHAPNVRPLIHILPNLSTDDIFALRAEYKNHAKVAGQGINIAKHIKMRVPGNVGKAAYATALGRWESEAYWANAWYQGGATRRELLIEALMGRSNGEIREIKNCFKDKRYGDDLEKCMKAELKADKFRTAILLALEERRMADRAALNGELVQRDVRDLYRSLTGREGGETAMIEIIVVRSDAHLREVLRLFERTYHRNFGRDMIDKSQNLVVSKVPCFVLDAPCSVC